MIPPDGFSRQARKLLPVVPLITILVIAVAAAAAYSGDISELLIYDRRAVLNWQLWRIASGSLVHFSASHLWYNGAALLAAGALVESPGRRRFAIMLLTAAIAVGSVIHLFAPQFDRYAGLSGVVYAAVAFVAVERLWTVPGRQWLCACVIALLCVKTSYELLTGSTMFASYDMDVAAAPASHLTGLIVGLTTASWQAVHSSRAAFSTHGRSQISRSLAS